ncbi:MAG: VirB3 family type IV secretion system protein [Legionellales bacterium]|nr:VirB3 family type IV secretion system protein [Legionellales bacterium]
MDEQELLISPIYQGMHITAMKAGVPIKTLVILLELWMMIVALMQAVIITTVGALIIYIIIRLAYRADPNWSQVLLKAMKCWQFKNYSIWRCESYGAD